MSTKINPLSWGRRLAKETIRKGKQYPRASKTSNGFVKGMRKHYANMAKTFKKGA